MESILLGLVWQPVFWLDIDIVYSQYIDPPVNIMILQYMACQTASESEMLGVLDPL